MATWLLRIVLSCHFSNSLLNPTKSRVLTARNASRQRIISQRRGGEEGKEAFYDPGERSEPEAKNDP